MAPDDGPAADRRRRAQRSVDPELPPEPLTGPGHRLAPGVLLAISAGGIAGTLARYGVGRLFTVGPSGFPWATFTVNLTGSLALGVLLTLLLTRWPADRYVRSFAAVGFIGAYTTFSTFVVDADLLAKDGHVATAAVYVAASLLGGLAAVFTGVAATRSLLARGGA
jgi:CrcB protein